MANTSTKSEDQLGKRRRSYDFCSDKESLDRSMISKRRYSCPDTSTISEELSPTQHRINIMKLLGQLNQSSKVNALREEKMQEIQNICVPKEIKKVRTFWESASHSVTPKVKRSYSVDCEESFSYQKKRQKPQVFPKPNICSKNLSLLRLNSAPSVTPLVTPSVTPLATPIPTPTFTIELDTDTPPSPLLPDILDSGRLSPCGPGRPHSRQHSSDSTHDNFTYFVEELVDTVIDSVLAADREVPIMRTLLEHDLTEDSYLNNLIQTTFTSSTTSDETVNIKLSAEEDLESFTDTVISQVLNDFFAEQSTEADKRLKLHKRRTSNIREPSPEPLSTKDRYKAARCKPVVPAEIWRIRRQRSFGHELSDSETDPYMDLHSLGYSTTGDSVGDVNTDVDTYFNSLSDDIINEVFKMLTFDGSEDSDSNDTNSDDDDSDDDDDNNNDPVASDDADSDKGESVPDYEDVYEFADEYVTNIISSVITEVSMTTDSGVEELCEEDINVEVFAKYIVEDAIQEALNVVRKSAENQQKISRKSAELPSPTYGTLVTQPCCGVVTSRDSLVTSRDSLVTSRDRVVTSRDSLVTSRDSLVTSRDSLVTSRDFSRDTSYYGTLVILDDDSKAKAPTTDPVLEDLTQLCEALGANTDSTKRNSDSTKRDSDTLFDNNFLDSLSSVKLELSENKRRSQYMVMSPSPVRENCEIPGMLISDAVYENSLDVVIKHAREEALKNRRRKGREHSLRIRRHGSLSYGKQRSLRRNRKNLKNLKRTSSKRRKVVVLTDNKTSGSHNKNRKNKTNLNNSYNNIPASDKTYFVSDNDIPKYMSDLSYENLAPDVFKPNFVTRFGSFSLKRDISPFVRADYEGLPVVDRVSPGQDEEEEDDEDFYKEIDEEDVEVVAPENITVEESQVLSELYGDEDEADINMLHRPLPPTSALTPSPLPESLSFYYEASEDEGENFYDDISDKAASENYEIVEGEVEEEYTGIDETDSDSEGSVASVTPDQDLAEVNVADLQCDEVELHDLYGDEYGELLTEPPSNHLSNHVSNHVSNHADHLYDNRLHELLDHEYNNLIRNKSTSSSIPQHSSHSNVSSTSISSSNSNSHNHRNSLSLYDTPPKRLHGYENLEQRKVVMSWHGASTCQDVERSTGEHTAPLCETLSQPALSHTVTLSQPGVTRALSQPHTSSEFSSSKSWEGVDDAGYEVPMDSSLSLQECGSGEEDYASSPEHCYELIGEGNNNPTVDKKEAEEEDTYNPDSEDSGHLYEYIPETMESEGRRRAHQKPNLPDLDLGLDNGEHSDTSQLYEDIDMPTPVTPAPDGSWETSQSPDLNTDNVSSESRNISSESRNASSESRNISSESRNVSSESRNASSESRNMSPGSRNISSETRNMSPESRNISSESRNISSESRNISSESRNMSSESRNMSSESRNASSETHDVIKINNDTTLIAEDSELFTTSSPKLGVSLGTPDLILLNREKAELEEPSTSISAPSVKPIFVPPPPPRTSIDISPKSRRRHSEVPTASGDVTASDDVTKLMLDRKCSFMSDVSSSGYTDDLESDVESSDHDLDHHGDVADDVTAAELVVAEALWDHVSLSGDQLEFRAGQLIEVLQQDGKWWKGRDDAGRVGWFPSNSVRLRISHEADEAEAEEPAPTTRRMTIMQRMRTNSCRPKLNPDWVRQKVIEEIINNESGYIKNLEYVIEGPLKEARLRMDIFSVEQLEILFCNIEELLSFQVEFLESLKSCINSTAVYKSEIGETFTLYQDRFVDIYSRYCNNHSTAIAEYTLLNQHLIYSIFFESCRLLKNMDNIALDGYLLRPVQRICQYQLQLKELLKYTNQTHPDYNKVKTAEQIMSRVAVTVNERKRRTENINKLVEWQNSVEDWRGEGILVRSTVLIHSGNLYKISAGNRQMRKFFLFDRQLVYCRKLLGTGRLQYKGRINLDQCQTVDLEDNEESSVLNGWKMENPAKKKWVILYSKCGADKTAWLSALQEERDQVERDRASNFTIPETLKQAAYISLSRSSSTKHKKQQTITSFRYKSTSDLRNSLSERKSKVGFSNKSMFKKNKK